MTDPRTCPHEHSEPVDRHLRDRADAAFGERELLSYPPGVPKRPAG